MSKEDRPIYAIVRSGGRQYRVEPNQVLDVDKLQAEVGSTIDITDVLLIAGNGDVQVGSPFVDDARVVAEVLEHGRDEKLLVFKYKNKTRYRRRFGHRQHFTRLAIRDIVVSGKSSAPEAEADEKPKRPSRRAAKKTEEPKAQAIAETSEASAEAPAAEAEAPVAEAPAVEEEAKPKTRRARKADAPEAEAEEKPKARRAPRAKKADAEADSEAKPARKPRATRKKAEPEAEDKKEDSGE